MNIVTIAICAVICGADDFVAIAKFGRVKQKWLSRFLDLKDGISSRSHSFRSRDTAVVLGLRGKIDF